MLHVKSAWSVSSFLFEEVTMAIRCTARLKATLFAVVVLVAVQPVSTVGANAEDAVPSSSAQVQPKPVADICTEVSDAFLATFSTPRFSYRIKAANDEKFHVIREEVRIVDNVLFLQRPSGEWGRHELSLPLSSLSAFHVCVRQSTTGGKIHYSAWSTSEGAMVPIELWVSTETGKLLSTRRNYSATGQMYHARTVEQDFDYALSSAATPKHYTLELPFLGIWAADGDLR
ncbi:hypothetical protein [Rhizobium tumorigenes]|uniref:Uncharacterized protein n=1 Tax=Rhizobium tumorigenes TaxID=2041385 RepID=A0AAF1K8N7_9HYPH|nr:hypothetical protein [Rhizobium tumorigenes]WFR94866.1 hypothetical protein PR017_13790 [Rhizobium tumorigenes]